MEIKIHTRCVQYFSFPSMFHDDAASERKLNLFSSTNKFVVSNLGVKLFVHVPMQSVSVCNTRRHQFSIAVIELQNINTNLKNRANK